MPNKKRKIDQLVKENYSWWTKSFVFIKKTKIKTWQGVFIIAFVAGIAATLAWTLSNNWHPFSSAASRVPKEACMAVPEGGTFTNPTRVKIYCGSWVNQANFQWDNEIKQKINNRRAKTVYQANQNKTLAIAGNSMDPRARSYISRIANYERRIANYERRVKIYKSRIKKYESLIKRYKNSRYSWRVRYYQRIVNIYKSRLTRYQNYIVRYQNLINQYQEKLANAKKSFSKSYKFKVEEKLPDLMIESIELEERTVGNNKTPSYYYTTYVKNIGTGNAEKSIVRIRISPSQPQTINDGDYFNCLSEGGSVIPSNDLIVGDILKPGERERQRDYFNPVKAGYITITVTADSYGAVDESNEDNNILSKRFYVSEKIIKDKCPNQCENDSCYDCSDSDGGKDYYEKGITIYGGHSYEDWCTTSHGTEGKESSCLGSECEVVEFYCDANTGRDNWEYYNCSNGCEDGACIKEDIGIFSAYTWSSPVAQKVIKGTSQFHFANIILDASNSSEDIKVTQLVITDIPASGGKTMNISNIKLYVNGVAKSVIKNGSIAAVNTAENFTFSLSSSDAIIIPKGITTEIQVKGDVSSSAISNATHTFKLSKIAAQGNNSGSAININPSGFGQPMTIIQEGALDVSIDPSNPDSSLIAAGSAGVTLSVFKFEAKNEDIQLDSIALSSDVSNPKLTSVNDYSKIYLYDEDGHKVTEATPTSTISFKINLPAYSENGGSWNSGFKVNNGSSAKLYVKADFAGISGQRSISGHQVGWKIISGGVNAIGSESGYIVNVSGSANSNTHYIYKSVPTVTILSLPTSTLTNGTSVLFKFSVTADSAGDIDFAKASFRINTNGPIVNNLKLYDITNGEVELNVVGVGKGIINKNVEILFDTDKVRTITAGSTIIFELSGSIIGANYGKKIATHLLSDAEQTNNGLLSSFADINSSNYFMWSDRSASSHSIYTTDWINGFLVRGFLYTTASKEAILSY